MTLGPTKAADGQRDKARAAAALTHVGRKYDKESSVSKSETWLWRIRTFVLLLGLVVAAWGAFKAYHHPKDHLWLMLNTVVWSIGPPTWFMVEYVYLFPKLDNNPAHKDDLKYGQGLFKAFWAGIAALLVAIYKIQAP